MQWCMPVRRADAGVVDGAELDALHAQFGVTSEDFGRAVVQLRAYAATNPAAWGFERPITLGGPPGVAVDRRAVHPPVRLLPGDRRLGRGRDHRAPTGPRDLRRPPVVIAAAGGAGLFEQEIASDHYRPDLSVMDGSVALADALFDRFGHRPRRHRRGDDLRRVLADPAHAARGAGFCGPGEAKDFVADGNLALDGALPCNTNGGLIGEGYIHGLNLVLEATRQLRGTAVNQVADARTVLVTASRTGAILTADRDIRAHPRISEESRDGECARRNPGARPLVGASPGRSPACCSPTTAPTSSRSSRRAAIRFRALPGTTRGSAAGAAPSST